MAIEERWSVLSECVQDQETFLRELVDKWSGLEADEVVFRGWVDEKKSRLTEMQRSPTDDPEELQRQDSIITVRENRKKLRKRFYDLDN